MQVIPVVDVLAGTVVHAVRGQRERYRPIISGLCPGSDPVRIATALVAYCASPVLYVADLDALLGEAPQYKLLAAIAAALPGVEIWIDCACREIDDVLLLRAALETHSRRMTPVFGTESLDARSRVSDLFAHRDRAILSLDRRGGAPIDPAGCWTATQSWPRRVIAMTLDRVGTDVGPDLETFRTVREMAPRDATVIGAGGIRHLDDLRAAEEAGARAWLVASALHSRALPPATRDTTS